MEKALQFQGLETLELLAALILRDLRAQPSPLVSRQGRWPHWASEAQGPSPRSGVAPGPFSSTDLGQILALKTFLLLPSLLTQIHPAAGGGRTQWAPQGTSHFSIS